MIKLDYIKIINVSLLKAPERELKHNPQKEHLQYIYLTKDFYPEFIKNFYKSIRKKNGNLIEIGKRIEQTPYQREYLSGQKTFEKMLTSFISHE